MPQQNLSRINFIRNRIDDLLPTDNFFFYKMFKGDFEDVDQMNKIEK